MKSILLSAIALLITLPVFAQWNGSGTHIYNTNSGNVGIGTTTPRDRLDLSTNRGFNVLVGDRTAYGSLVSSAGTIIGQNIKADNVIAGQMSFMNTTSDGASAIKMQYDQGIAFHTNNNGGSSGNAFSSERVRITPEGNIGIGTTSPASKLHVASQANTGSAAALIYGLLWYLHWC